MIFRKIAMLAVAATLAAGCGTAAKTAPGAAPGASAPGASAPATSAGTLKPSHGVAGAATAPASSSPSASPARTSTPARLAVPPAATTPPVTTPAPSPSVSCYPTVVGGLCYEPGQACRARDHGMIGVAGDGQKIICTVVNNVLVWKPY